MSLNREDWKIFLTIFTMILLVSSVAIGAGFVMFSDAVSPFEHHDTTPNVNTTTSSSYEKVYNETRPSIVSIIVEVNNNTVQGSGFMYTENGHIITNHHVIEDGDEIYVKYARGEWSKATKVGSDVYTDLAVIHANHTPSYATPLQVSEKLPNRGEKVLSIGTPNQLQGTLTTGVVSGIERSGRTRTGFTVPDMIQTDAALNPGNSGGPLLNTKGEVIGVSRARQGENIGFAISSRLMDRIASSLIETGEHNHPYVGIASLNINARIADQRDLDTTKGILITQVKRGTPASGLLEKAEISINETTGKRKYTGGDIILSIDGHPVYTNEDLGSYLLLNKSPGDVVTVTVLRNGTKTEVDFALDERPSV